MLIGYDGSCTCVWFGRGGSSLLAQLRSAATSGSFHSSCHSRHRLSSLTNQQSDVLLKLHPQTGMQPPDRMISSLKVESSASVCL